jgi:hypothetical protein
MGHEKVSLLLSLARDVPPHPKRLVLYEDFLRLSLAEAFGSLKTREAIPVLIRNIGIEEFVPGNTWSKGPERIASDYPAAGALINIGPEASRAVIKAYPDLKEPGNRLVAVFVVSQVEDVPEADNFLMSVAATSEPGSAMNFWATTGRKVPSISR